VPVDCSKSVVERSAAELTDVYPGLEVHGLIGDFERHLDHLPEGERRLVVFLGGTIGNFHPRHRTDFLSLLRGLLGPEDRLLLGTDLVKDVGRLEAAYNDSAGVTADFNKNVLRVLNRELDADFDLEAFEHVAFWDAENSWIDIRLRSLTEQLVTIPKLEMAVEFGPGEEMRTEISAKFTREHLERTYARVGLEMVEWWTDPDDLFALSLARSAEVA
jgi:L-histidine N-alpha-methyltransferase